MSLTNWNASASTDLSRIAEAELVPSSIQPDLIPSDNPPTITASPEAQFLADLLRSIQNNRDVHEAERKRRLDWEAQVEALYHERAADMELRLASMQQEIDNLKQALGQRNPGPSLSPVHIPPSHPDPSQPQVASFAVFSARGEDISPTVLGKRHRESLEPQEDLSTLTMTPSIDPISARLTENDIESILASKKKKDSRPTTIQTAMRAHLLRVLGTDSDKTLPPTHMDNLKLAPGSPIRFVWDKTPKQSPHNARMKQLIITDMQTSRALYPFVPETEFTWHTLDRTFDQAFTTLRQKYRTQTGQAPATEEERLEMKTKKARRSNRKKAKLHNRTQARSVLPVFQHPIFDKALDISMMSSESSDEGGDEMDGGDVPKRFRTRGFTWRSSRLQKLYSTLDLEDKFDKNRKPKRGAGKKERLVGLPKTGEEGLPPKGTMTWMLNRQFFHQVQPSDLVHLGVVDGSGIDFDWHHFDLLGHDSDEDEMHVSVDTEV